MIQLVKKGGSFGRDFISQLKLRSEESNRQVDAAVSEIIENVRRRGDQAVREYTLKFDGSVPDETEISVQEMRELANGCEPDFLAALERAAANIRDFHSRQKQQSWFNTNENGVMMGQRIRGLSRVGIYVPGGTTIQ